MPPATYSITKYGCPSASPRSYTCTTFGCFTAAIASASATNRATSPGDACAEVRIILMATVWRSAACRALYTTPIPPRPSSHSNS